MVNSQQSTDSVSWTNLFPKSGYKNSKVNGESSRDCELFRQWRDQRPSREKGFFRHCSKECLLVDHTFVTYGGKCLAEDSNLCNFGIRRVEIK